jgi:hypothetical protein
MAMNLEQIKYHTSDLDDSEGILLVDIDETEPYTDEFGNLCYYSMDGHYVFPVDEEEEIDE